MASLGYMETFSQAPYLPKKVACLGVELSSRVLA